MWSLCFCQLLMKTHTDRHTEATEREVLVSHLPPDVTSDPSPNIPLFLSSRQAILNYCLLKFDAVQFGRMIKMDKKNLLPPSTG